MTLNVYERIVKMQTFQYKDFLGSVDFSLEDNVLYGKILHIKGLITYEAETIPNLRKEFEAAVDDYLQFCEENNIEASKSFNGKFNVRINTDLHKQAAMQATKQGITLNAFVSKAIENEINSNKRAIPVAYQYMQEQLSIHVHSILKMKCNKLSAFDAAVRKTYSYQNYGITRQ